MEHPLDPFSEERLLRGEPNPDLPPQWAGVAGVLARAAEATPSSGVDERAVVAAFVASAPLTARRSQMLGKFVTAKVAAASAAVLLGAGGAAAAAAATGVLPGFSGHASLADSSSSTSTSSSSTSSTSSTTEAPDTSSTEADTSSTADAADSSSTTASSSTPSSTATPGVLTSPGIAGLCNAFLVRYAQSNPSFTQGDGAFSALVAAHGGPAATATYCKGVVKTHSTTTTGGSSTSGSSAASDSHGASGTTHQPPTTPPAASHGRAPTSTPAPGGRG